MAFYKWKCITLMIEMMDCVLTLDESDQSLCLKVGSMFGYVSKPPY